MIRFLKTTAALSVVSAIASFTAPAIAQSGSWINENSVPRPAYGQTQQPLAQTPSACQEIDAVGGLYLYERPSVYSRIISAVPYQSQITIENPQPDSWVYVSEPAEGYTILSSVLMEPCAGNDFE